MWRDEAGDAVVAWFRTQLGKPYLFGGGHGWTPAQPIPPAMDCSGSVHVAWWHVTGQNLEDGTSQTMWGSGVHLLEADPLLPGDTVFFVGSGGPSPDHVGTCVSYDKASRTGVYISYYSTALGCIFHNYVRGGGTGGNAWVGAVRTANLLPERPAPPEEVDVIQIVKNPHNGGMVVVDLAHGTYEGISNPDMLAYYQSSGVKRGPDPSVAIFDKWNQSGTI